MKNETPDYGRLGRRVSLLCAFALMAMASTQACGGGKSNSGLVKGTGGNGGSMGMIDLTTSGNNNNSNNSSSNGSGGAGGEDCGGTSVNAEPLKANLLLVIDRSGSMDQTPDGFDDSKWATLVDSLENALDSVPETMSVGVQFFPDASVDDVSGCGIPSGGNIAVPIMSGSDGINAVTDALNDPANEPDGNTPAADALGLALEYFTNGDGADLEGDNYVLLAIDGGPNCNSDLSCGVDTCTANIDNNVDMPEFCGDGSDAEQNLLCLDDERTIAQVKALKDAGITTLVVGIQGSDLAEYVAVLDQLAVEGGAPANDTSPKYYQVQDAQELGDTLLSLTSNLVTNCELVLDEPPPNVNKVNVFVDDEVVPKGENGWAFDDDSHPTEIVLQGDTCDLVETQGVKNVTVEYGCPTIQIIK